MAVMAVLSAVLFPVFRAAMDSAKKSTCLLNYRQIGLALSMYQTDYDDGLPPVNYRSVTLGEPEKDRTWVQTLFPYVGHFGPFECPSDTGRYNRRVPQPDPRTPGDPLATYYIRSLRSNLGYNYMYLSPLVKMSSGEWQAFPVKEDQIANPSNTITFIDSVWDRTDAGLPYGGGSWVVVPPCRYAIRGGEVYDTFHLPPEAELYSGFEPEGWQPESSNSWLVYGGAWPWHRGMFNLLFKDGHTATVHLRQLIEGCDYRDGWEGLITRLEMYRWDLDR